ncbi:heavy metal translocating P-type ATPase [Paraflavitalea sp. CAU 1676]|uniref:heavy metal translocating P-type ATPase n=1 Tax=Paraflavitalea sp. CAU 1676 TaxID=3032598 RepID=UPI0023D9D391|nr:heavy metal translocating P-type ATPase [Paraflavitalea sp. CAU 1676]MDF2191318.1 heavy metal translocating P-type ATPase [Paraflavitalea sp. CAU 1676]
MEKVKIDLDIVLPKIPDEKDACVERLISSMERQRGIEKAHLVPGKVNNEVQLCFHYYPDKISIERVEQLAKEAGAEITNQYSHLLLNVEGIRHPRHARLLEKKISSMPGLENISVSGNGFIRIEFDLSKTNGEDVIKNIKKNGLRFTNVDEPHGHERVQKNEHGHGGKKEDDQEHTHGGIFGKNTELIFSFICGAMLGGGFGLSFMRDMAPIVPLSFYIAAYFFGGFFTTKEAIEAISKGDFEIDFLMLVAAIGAAILGQWAEGALLLFLFSLGHALEHFAMEKARKSIAALTELAPKTALLKTGGISKEVKIEDLKQGDVIVVKPNTKVSADGIVVKGNGSVNQAPITGESIPADKESIGDTSFDLAKADKLDPKYRVFAGTINGNELLEVKVSKEANDSTLSRLVKMVNEAQTQKSPTQQFTDKFEKYFVPSVLILVVLLCFAFLVIDEPFSKSFYRAMSVLVAASPCALAISTPSAVLSGVARAARAGVLIKGGRPLEDLGTLTAMAFDKTGTLTEGKPKLTKVVPLSNGITEVQLLKIVVAVEALSDHPLAKAIVRDGKAKLDGELIPEAHDLEAVLGKGIKAALGSDEIFAGNLALYDSLDDSKPSEDIINTVRKAEEEGNTSMLIRKNKEYIGMIAVMDTPRPEAKEALLQLKQEGIKKMVMLTGDNQKVAEAIAAQTGITEAWGGLLPEQKVAAIIKLAQQENKVAMVGDGVNDAPAMAKSTVGISMGAAGSDVALETADIALMGDKLNLLPFAIGLSRKARKIIKQNLVISLGVVVLLIPLTISGVATIGPAVIAHEGSTLVVVFNGLRLLAYRDE